MFAYLILVGKLCLPIFQYIDIHPLWVSMVSLDSTSNPQPPGSTMSILSPDLLVNLLEETMVRCAGWSENRDGMI